jgi:L-malate glycosyltransferase
MNIALIVSSLEFGGAEKQTILDANILSESNKVYLISFISGPQRQLINNQVKYIKLQKNGYLKTAIQLSKIIKDKEIKIIHASLFAPMIISALASNFCKIKIIWHFHSHEYDIPIQSKIAFRYLAKLPSIKKILFVNHELIKYFSLFQFPPSKIGVLYNHSEIYKENNFNEFIRFSKITSIGFLGRVVKLKRVEYLVELASFLISKDLLNFRIHIVGDGETLEMIKNMVKKNYQNEFFLFHGFQSDVAEFYKKFDFFVNPSSEECLSMAMIDAGMMALPIVAFNVGGNDEIVVNSKTGFIVNSKDEFFKRCFELALNGILRKEMGLNSKQHCMALFSKETHLEQLNSIYNEISARC